jgi:hypothetical protein
MPKHHKKGEIKGKQFGVAIADADDDFDNMLAELQASDFTNARATTATTTTSAGSNHRSSSSSSTSSTSLSSPTGSEVTEAMIVQASARGNVAQLRRRAKHGVRVSSSKPLSEATMKNNIAAVRCLVKELKADCNQTDDQDCTPLFIAAVLRNLEMVRCLVEELGADVKRGSNGGNNPLHAAAEIGLLAGVRCLVKELGADVNRVNNRGSSALFFAAQEGNLEVVQCLVKELNANVNLAAQDGSTPLMIAAVNMHHKLVRYLLKHGADPQASHIKYGTAAQISQDVNAHGEQTAYLQARTHCANSGCTNVGLKKCERCLQAYFCGSASLHSGALAGAQGGV